MASKTNTPDKSYYYLVSEFFNLQKETGEEAGRKERAAKFEEKILAAIRYEVADQIRYEESIKKGQPYGSEEATEGHPFNVSQGGYLSSERIEAIRYSSQL